MRRPLERRSERSQSQIDSQCDSTVSNSRSVIARVHSPKLIIFNGTPSARDADAVWAIYPSETRFVAFVNSDPLRNLAREEEEEEERRKLTTASPLVLWNLRTKVVTREPAANRRRGGAGRERNARALELAQKKQVVDVPRQQREQHEDDAV